MFLVHSSLHCFLKSPRGRGGGRNVSLMFLLFIFSPLFYKIASKRFLQTASEDVVCSPWRRALRGSCPASLDVLGPPCQEPQESRLPEWLEVGGWRLEARGCSCKAGNGLSLPGAGGTPPLRVPKPAQGATRMCTADSLFKPTARRWQKPSLVVQREWTRQSPATRSYGNASFLQSTFCSSL